MRKSSKATKKNQHGGWKGLESILRARFCLLFINLCIWVANGPAEDEEGEEGWEKAFPPFIYHSQFVFQWVHPSAEHPGPE